MDVYRKDILVLLSDSPDVGYVFGSFVKVPRRGDRTFSSNEKRTFDMNERFVTSLRVTKNFDVSNFSIIVKLLSEGSHFDMPDTRLRIDINLMKQGHLCSEVRRCINDGDSPETRVFATTKNIVKIFSIAAIPQKNASGYTLLDNLLVNVTDEQVKKIQKAKKDQRKAVDVEKGKKTSSSDYDSARSGIKVQSDSDSNLLKSGSLYASGATVVGASNNAQKGVKKDTSKGAVSKERKGKDNPGSFNWAEEMVVKEEEKKKRSSQTHLENVLNVKSSDSKKVKNQNALRKTSSKPLECQVEKMKLTKDDLDYDLRFETKLNDSFSSSKTLSHHGDEDELQDFDLRNVSREVIERALLLVKNGSEKMRFNKDIEEKDKIDDLDIDVLGERVASDVDDVGDDEKSAATSVVDEDFVADEYQSDSQ